MNAKKIIVVILVTFFSSTFIIILLFSESKAIPSSDVDIRDNIAYIPNTRGLAIFKILPDLNSKKIKQIEFDATAFGVSIDKDFLYVGGGFGMKIFNLSDDLENPTFLGEYNKGGGNQIAINNNLAFLTFMNDGLEIIDVQDPMNPVLVGHFNLGNRDLDVEVVGSTLYLADPDRGLEVVNVINPSNPQIISTLPIKGAWDIWRVNNLLYLGCHSNGVRIINISSPTTPKIISTYPSDGDVYALAGDQDILYVGNFYGRIEVLNVSNPAQPSLLGRTPEDFSSHGLYYDGTYAYLVGHHTQFSILKFDPDTSELRFYSIITTKSASWDLFLTTPIIIAVLAVIRRASSQFLRIKDDNT
ncbi:MAG: LVIVD repeat-containing protein [Candidatus Thorarchaeota archaeon]